MGDCALVIVVIGDRWLVAESRGRWRRLDEADDVVRIEIEAALSREHPGRAGAGARRDQCVAPACYRRACSRSPIATGSWFGLTRTFTQTWID